MVGDIVIVTGFVKNIDPVAQAFADLNATFQLVVDWAGAGPNTIVPLDLAEENFGPFLAHFTVPSFGKWARKEERTKERTQERRPVLRINNRGSTYSQTCCRDG